MSAGGSVFGLQGSANLWPQGNAPYEMPSSGRRGVGGDGGAGVGGMVVIVVVVTVVVVTVVVIVTVEVMPLPPPQPCNTVADRESRKHTPSASAERVGQVIWAKGCQRL